MRAFNDYMLLSYFFNDLKQIDEMFNSVHYDGEIFSCCLRDAIEKKKKNKDKDATIDQRRN